ncbi:MAG: hypothetical protein JW829_07420 [Pirellulales bacterium]|nr:hypothetical protein [Pirellulales bacterium]
MATLPSSNKHDIKPDRGNDVFVVRNIWVISRLFYFATAYQKFAVILAAIKLYAKWFVIQRVPISPHLESLFLEWKPVLEDATNNLARRLHVSIGNAPGLRHVGRLPDGEGDRFYDLRQKVGA